MADKIRIGSVPYLNAWPLVHGLAEREDVTLRLEVPSALAALLKNGEVDAAMAPSIEYFRLAAEGTERVRKHDTEPALRGYVALPVAAIGSRGAIGSVRLFGYTEPNRLRRVLLDPASRTSNALARLIVTRRLGSDPHFVLPEEIGPSPTRRPDAELVMGDRALSAERPDSQWVLDMGEEWEHFTHRPFIYAMWIARADAPVERLTEILSEAKRQGMAAMDTLVQRAVELLGLPLNVARRYLTHQVRYDFGVKEQDGLRAFYRMAAEEGLVPEGARLRVAKAL